MNPNQDRFGHDPHVQAMRRAFSRIETWDRRQVRALNLSPFDPRLKSLRQEALRRHQEALGRHSGSLDEEAYVMLYQKAYEAQLRDMGLDPPEEGAP